MINNWDFQWKMNFNPDPKKPAQKKKKKNCSRKVLKLAHPLLVYNNSIVAQSISQKHLGMLLDTKLGIQEHLKAYLVKLQIIHHILLRWSLLKIYRSFIRPHLF